MSFPIATIATYASLSISALALWASWRANSHAKAALVHSEKVKLLEIQGEIVREIDFQDAKLGSLLAITAETAQIYEQSEELRVRDPDGFALLHRNIKTVEKLRSVYERQRKVAERNIGAGNIASQTEILANVRRLTLHIQEDIEKERRNFERLRKQG